MHETIKKKGLWSGGGVVTRDGHTITGSIGGKVFWGRGMGIQKLDLGKLDPPFMRGKAFVEKAQNQAHRKCSTNAPRSY